MGSKKNIILLSLFCFFFLEISAQVGIGTTNPDASSVLDVESTNAGVLIPRVVLTSTLVSAPIMTPPATSLLVYNTNTTTGANRVTPGFYFWRNDRWNRLNDSDKVYGEINNSPTIYPSTSQWQHMNPTVPIRFENAGVIQGVTPISFTGPPSIPDPAYQGFRIITSGVYRVSYSVSLYMDHFEGSPKVIKFYLTTGSDPYVAAPSGLPPYDALNPNLRANRIPGSTSYTRIVHTGYTSSSLNIIVRLSADDVIRLFQLDYFTRIWISPDTATMNIELIQAD